MVLIYAFMACLSAKAPQVSSTPTPVSTVITLASPEDDAHLSTPDAVVAALQNGFSDNGLSLERVDAGQTFTGIGTRAHRADWLLKQSGGALSVMIETEARPRSQLGGRFQWEVTATITVANGDSEPLVEVVRLPITLPHVHQGEQDALTAIGTRLADRTATLITRYQRSGS